MLFVCEPAPSSSTTEPADWPTIKAEILARLDLAGEFESLGVRFSRPAPQRNGLRECHAIDRADEVPSAFVNVETGVYHDSGGEGATLNLFDFALKHGGADRFGRWIDCVKHYALKAGVDLNGALRPGKNGRVREAEYHYRREDGSVAYVVFRYRLPSGKKTFSQHPPDGRGGWKYGPGCMDGVEPLPYRLPELLASDPVEEPVWVVEGEKDADRLAGLGLVATTNHQGAQSTDATWPRFAHRFRGREVFVLPDNDPGGLVHARRVAGHLHGIARTVKLVVLPGLPSKGDVSDWLDRGHGLDELGRLASRADAWEPGRDSADEAGSEVELNPDRDATVADLRRVASADSWLWPGWIGEACLTLLAAEGGVGKTRLVFDLHRRIVQGDTWPDGSSIRAAADSRFLWVAADNHHQDLVELAAEFGVPDEQVYVNASAADPYDGTSLQTEDELAAFEARIGRVKPLLVVIDTVGNTTDLKSQDSADAKRQYKPLQEIAIRCRTPILCVTHLNAGGKVLGRRAVEKVRSVIQMECPDPDGQPHRRKLWISKTKALRPAPLGVTMRDGGNDYDDAPPSADSAAAGPGPGRPPVKTGECAAWLKERLAGGAERVSTLRTEAEERGWTAKVLYGAKDRLCVVQEERGLRNHKWWLLPDTETVTNE